MPSGSGPRRQTLPRSTRYAPIACARRSRRPSRPSSKAGRSTSIIATRIVQRAGSADVLLVEGAGGLLVPIRDSITWLDLAVRVSLPVLIVAANRLGTINHCALTARVAAAAGLTVRGFVLSEPSAARDESASTNAAAISALTGLRCLGMMTHAPAGDGPAPPLAVEAALGGAY